MRTYKVASERVMSGADPRPGVAQSDMEHCTTDSADAARVAVDWATHESETIVVSTAHWPAAYLSENLERVSGFTVHASASFEDVLARINRLDEDSGM